MTTASLAPPLSPPGDPPFAPPIAVSRGLAVGLLGSVAFGAAAGLGHGLTPMLRGAWMSPALFIGGALLATPPLYLASSYAGSRASAEELLAEVAAALDHTGLILLGLSAPAAFFSVTLRTPSAWVLLLGTAVSLGALSIRAVSRRALAPATVAHFIWSAFALALGVRLLLALVCYTELAHWVTR